MNESHAILCSSAEWSQHLCEDVIGPIGGRVDLGSQMLEIGPGPGAATEHLRKLVSRLTVLEVDEAAAKALEDRYATMNVDVRCGDATAIPFDDSSFDSVGAFTMLHHVPTVRMQDLILFEVVRVLRPGGVFVGSDSLPATELHEFHQDDTYNPVEPGTLYTRLRTAGFGAITIEVDDIFRFVARKPADGLRQPAPPTAEHNTV